MLRSLVGTSLVRRGLLQFPANASLRSVSVSASSLVSTAPTDWQRQVPPRRFYTAMTKEEEEQEKARVSHLSPEEKDQELRSLNRQLAKLETLKGINTGELYTWSGRYKALMRDYGFPLFVYYWCCWTVMGAGVYLAIDVGGFDAMELLARIDAQFGWSLTEKVDPQLGKIGLALMVNEVLEPVRLPFVITTLKPAMDTISPPKF